MATNTTTIKRDKWYKISRAGKSGSTWVQTSTQPVAFRHTDQEGGDTRCANKPDYERRNSTLRVRIWIQERHRFYCRQCK